MCYEDMLQPCMLAARSSGACGHCLCRDCSTTLFEHAQRNGQPAQCPICREVVVAVVRNRLAEDIAHERRQLQEQMAQQQRSQLEAERLELECARLERELQQRDIHRLEEERLQLQAEQARMEDQQRQLAEQQRRMEVEQRRMQQERAKMEEQAQLRTQQEQHQMEMERARMRSETLQEQQRMQQAQQLMEQEQQRMQQEQQRIEQERARMEQELANVLRMQADQDRQRRLAVQREQERQEKQSQPTAVMLPSSSAACTLFHMDSFALWEHLGQSRVSNVRRARFKVRAPGQPENVALKHCRLHDGQCCTPQELCREATVVFRLCHPNIVRLLGVVMTNTVGNSTHCQVALVMEFCPWDADFLVCNACASFSVFPGLPHPLLPSTLVARMCLELLRALAHMHASGLVHRAIVLTAVLLTADLHVRVACLGHAAPPHSAREIEVDMAACAAVMQCLVGASEKSESGAAWVDTCVRGINADGWTALRCLQEYSMVTGSAAETVTCVDAALFEDRALGVGLPMAALEVPVHHQ